MEFEENNIAITLPKYKSEFVYFLLKDNIVVYVGQTKKQGIKRPLSHTDKDFDTIKIIYYKKEEIDFMEDYFIKKYNPIYNKMINYSKNYSMTRARNKIRQITNNDKIRVNDLKKYIKKYNIETFIEKSKLYIDLYNFEILVSKIMEEI